MNWKSACRLLYNSHRRPGFSNGWAVIGSVYGPGSEP